MVMKWAQKKGGWLGLIGLWVLVACGGNAAASQWVRAPGWSRAQPIGITQVGDPAPIALDEAGNSYFFLVDRESSRPHLLSYTPDMTLRWELFLPISLQLPDKPSLFWQDGGLDIYWLSEQILYYSRLSEAGESLREPLALSKGQVGVAYYAVAYDQQGTAHIWFAGPRREPGLYALRLVRGTVAAAATLVDAAGIAPVLRLDPQNSLHAVWIHHPPGDSRLTIFYAGYAAAAYQPDQAKSLIETPISSTSIIRGPTIGLDDNLVYLFWSIEIRTGPSAGVVNTRYVTFPPGQPENVSSPLLLTAPTSADLTYTPWPEGTFVAGSRVPFAQTSPPFSDALNHIASGRAAANELPIVFHHTEVQYEYRQTRGQIALLFWQHGEPTTYQLLSFSNRSAHSPFLASDLTNHLYVTWLEAAAPSGFQIYFTSTAPETVTALNRLSGQDVSRISGTILFGMLSGIALSPLVVFIWLIGPVFVTGISSFFRRGEDEHRVTTGGVISIILALTVYWLIKLFSLPDIFVIIPFANWVPILPVWLNEILRLGVPLLVTFLGLFTAWWFTIKRQIASPLYFILLFGLVDGVLTMAVYGFLFYNL